MHSDSVGARELFPNKCCPPSALRTDPVGRGLGQSCKSTVRALLLSNCNFSVSLHSVSWLVVCGATWRVLGQSFRIVVFCNKQTKMESLDRSATSQLAAAPTAVAICSIGYSGAAWLLRLSSRRRLLAPGDMVRVHVLLYTHVIGLYGDIQRGY